jgi:hypothetical protein
VHGVVPIVCPRERTTTVRNPRSAAWGLRFVTGFPAFFTTACARRLGTWRAQTLVETMPGLPPIAAHTADLWFHARAMQDHVESPQPAARPMLTPTRASTSLWTSPSMVFQSCATFLGMPPPQYLGSRCCRGSAAQPAESCSGTNAPGDGADRAVGAVHHGLSRHGRTSAVLGSALGPAVGRVAEGRDGAGLHDVGCPGPATEGGVGAGGGAGRRLVGVRPAP